MKQYKILYRVIYISLFMAVCLSVIIIFMEKSENNNAIMINKNIILIIEVLLSFFCIILSFIPKLFELFNQGKGKKKGIYISYSEKDSEIQQKITDILEKELKTQFVIQRINKTNIPLQNNQIPQESYYVIVVSSNYVQDLKCIRECNHIVESKKKFYPIVINSYKELNKLPDDVSTVKSAFIRNDEKPKDISSEISSFAKEILSSSKTVAQAS